MTDALYVPVILLFGWVGVRALLVCRQSKQMVSGRQIVFFAQHYSVFVIVLAVTAVGLSVWTMWAVPGASDLLRRSWAFFDALVALLLLAELRNIELNLRTGRQG